jgi:beta-N-acetylhexosaminidase
MNKKIMLPIIGCCTLLFGLLILLGFHNNQEEVNINKLEVTVLSSSDEMVMVQDKDNIIYTIDALGIEACYGGNVILEYMGILNKNMELQDVSVVGCEVVMTANVNEMPDEWNDKGMFSDYYKLAYNKVKNMTLDEKIAQILLVRYPDSNGVELLKKYQFGGYVFFAKDFANKNKTDVKKMMSDLQKQADIPILTAVDEEGGKIVRISNNSNLADEPFASPSNLYAKGGLSLIKSDTFKKSTLLKSLGLNLNLAPVVDVVTDKNAYMYDRSLQQDTKITLEYAKSVIEASRGTGVSYTLKHFPGYGNNGDTHVGSATDTRSYDEIFANDLPPFESGIKAGAEAVLVSHNKVISIDGNNPASLSPSVHNLLRNQLDFTGIVITDDLSMGAVSNISDAAVKAILAGNDLIISTNYEADIRDIKNAINNGTLKESTIDKIAMRVIAWKYYKGLLFENQK